MENNKKNFLVDKCNTCNKCKNLNFALKKCKKTGEYLNTYTNTNGLVQVIRSKNCRFS